MMMTASDALCVLTKFPTMMDSSVDFTYFNTAPMPYFLTSDLSLTPLRHGSDSRMNAESVEHYDPAFAAFQQQFQYDPTQFVAQPVPQVRSKSPFSTQLSNKRPSMSRSEPSNHVAQSDEAEGSPNGNDRQVMGRSSSEEKDNLTPQQNKRKAQNRAAQRAFRERKERHVKDLEARNTTLQHEALALQDENEKLKRELARVSTENKILRATSCSSSNGPTPYLTEPDDLVTAGPLGYTPSSDYRRSTSMEPRSNSKSDWPSRGKWAQFGSLPTIAIEDGTGEPLLNAGATWDYIQAHDLVKKGLVDIGDVCEKLKKVARCDGAGPVFQEKDIDEAIRGSSVAGGRDELI